MPARVGIDLGTTYSLVATIQDGRPVVLPNVLGKTQTPSAVSIADDGTIVVGEAAIARALTHPDRTFRNFKRDMGTDRQFRYRNRQFRAEELSALVLGQLRRDAEAALGTVVEEAVVTVPAYFGELQRRATRDACEIAGLAVERLINEPTAAALAYGLQNLEREMKVVVLDLGGGTFDVSVLEIIEGVIEIQSSAGDARLGGEDFVEQLASEIARRAKSEHGLDMLADAATRASLLATCERVKRDLSAAEEVTFELPAGSGYRSAPPELTVVRADIDALWRPTLQRLHAPIRRALRDARMGPGDIDEVVLVGGATRMPVVRQLAEEMFGRPPLTRVSADEAVAQGAAVQIALKSGDESLGDLVATDVAPFSLGVSVVDTHGRRRIDDVFSPILERGKILPASRVEHFVTAADGQVNIRVQVYQGEHSLCRDNNKLGECELSGIPSGPAGEEAIDVRFTYDLNGILEVDMTIVSTRETKTLVLERSPGRMTEAEVDRARVRIAALKFHPRDALPNTTALSRAESLFTELRGHDRERLGHAMRVFRLALEEQDPAAIDARRRELLLLIDRLRK